MDSKGLVCASRAGLQPHKRPFAHDVPHQRDLLSAVRAIRPTALIGVSSQPGAFSTEVLQACVPAELAELLLLIQIMATRRDVRCRHKDKGWFILASVSSEFGARYKV